MTLVTWIYVLFTVGLLGFGVSQLLEHILHYRLKQIDSILTAGMIAATVYAQIFSLFYRVGIEANMGLLMLCVVIIIFTKKEIGYQLSQWKQEIKLRDMALVCTLLIAWAYFTSRGYMHYDSDLYHAQSIRWLEEYGVVPGLGNLHERFAYNSSFFALSALYSLKFVLGDSMHTMNGFFAFVLSMTCLPIIKSWKNKRFGVADFARIGAIYYLTTITNEVVSPASDYAVMCIVFFIIIKWLDALEQGCTEIAPYALLCVAGVYALTIKLTAGLIVLLVIKPACMLIREKRWKEIAIYIAMGLLAAIPWMARTVIISGWLFYPLTAIDLFDVDWKMEAFYIDVDAMQIKTWGRALYAIGLIDVPITDWFPNWFKTTLSGTEKMLIFASMISVVLVVLSICLTSIKRRRENLDMILVMSVLAASYLFWQTSAPLIRYGYAYILLLVFVVFGWYLQCIMTFLCQKPYGKICQIAIYSVFCICGIYKGVALGEYIYSCRLVPFYIWQQDYETYEAETYEVNGVTFYYPAVGDRIGYDYFPASCTKVNLEFRGDSMEDGFRKIEN